MRITRQIVRLEVSNMKTIDIVNGPKKVSTIIQGCMRMPSLAKEDAAKVIRTAYDCGVKISIYRANAVFALTGTNLTGPRRTFSQA